MPLQLLTNPVTWPSFTDNTIDSFIALDREPFIDRRNGATIVRLGDGVTPGGQLAFNQPIGKVFTPSILSPQNGALEIAVQPLITTSLFTGLNIDKSPAIHAASYWEIATDSGFTNIVYSSGNSRLNLTSLDLSVEDVSLAYETTHYVRVRYVSDAGPSTGWSPTASFTTRLDFPSQFVQELTGSDTGINDEVGRGLAISPDGSVIAAGAWYYNNEVAKQGAVYLYSKSLAWIEIAKITASDGVADDKFGSAIALSANGSTLIIGAMGVKDPNSVYTSGAIYVFTRTAGTNDWVEVQKIVDSNLTESQALGYLKIDITVDGTRFIMGDNYYNDPSGISNSGRGRVYTLVNGTYVEEASLTPPDPAAGGAVGQTVSLDRYGYTALLTGQTNNLKQTAYVFTRTGTTWSQAAALEPSDLLAGDQFGTFSRISDDGTTIIISAWLKPTAFSQGVAYIYRKDSNGTWVERQKIIPSDAAYSPGYGHDVDISEDGNIILTSSAGNSNGRYYIHRYNPSTGLWVEEIAKGNPNDNTLSFATMCALSGDGKTAVLGSNDERGRKGVVYIFN